MAQVTLPLREEHKELLPNVEALRAAADLVGEAPLDAVRTKVEEAYQFLAHHLAPHAQAEEAALYPVVARVMGAKEATSTMSRDHVEVGKLIGELASLRSRLGGKTVSPADARELRRVLYGLYAVVRLHFAKEEEVYLPLLDARLAPEDARHMFQAMEQAAGAAKARAAGTA